jgi:hypothetical protein
MAEGAFGLPLCFAQKEAPTTQRGSEAAGAQGGFSLHRGSWASCPAEFRRTVIDSVTFVGMVEGPSAPAPRHFLEDDPDFLSPTHFSKHRAPTS